MGRQHEHNSNNDKDKSSARIRIPFHRNILTRIQGAVNNPLALYAPHTPYRRLESFLTMITLIDNYDSFTYNLVQYLGDLGVETTVYRNDKVSVDQIMNENPKGLMISPGPSDPDHAGICLDLVQTAADTKTPLLGVCLGHQTIGQAFGGKIVKTTPLHGKVSNITHDAKSVFESLPTPLKVTRYHSLIIARETMPDDLEITAETEDGIIMGVQHKTLPIHGVQFHPESIETDHGHTMLKNFINII